MKSKLIREPRKAYVHGSIEAWWYENAKSIDVYVRDKVKGGDAISCRLPRALIADWIDRTKP